MDNTEPCTQNQLLVPIQTYTEPKIQTKIIERQSSFAEIKDSCPPPEQTSQLGKQLCINQPQVPSRQDILSIPETFNGHAVSIRSADTLITQQQRDNMKSEHVEQCLTQTSGFQVLQEKNENQNNYVSLKQQKSEAKFTLTHTQQIVIDNKSNATIQQKSNPMSEILVIQLNKRKNKLKITKSLQQNHIPNDLLAKKSQNLQRQPNAETTNQELKVTTENQSQIKQQTPKPEPLKIQSLFISSLRSNTTIKPPESTSQQKPKIWQMFKNKRQNKSPTTSNIQSNPKTQIATTTNNQSIRNSQTSQNNQQNSTIKAQITAQINTNLTSVQAHKQEQKRQGQPLFEEQKTKSVIIQFHESKHHPLQKRLQQRQKIESQPQLLKELSQQVQIVSEIINNQQPQNKKQYQKNEVQEEKIEKQQQKQQSIHQQPEQSQASASQRQQMLVDYTHNKKYQQQLQKLNREKIRQLQQKLKTQEQINRQLARSLSFPIKLITSAAVGASTAGIAWVAKKNKNISLLLGVATTLGTFVFSY